MNLLRGVASAGRILEILRTEPEIKILKSP